MGFNELNSGSSASESENIGVSEETIISAGFQVVTMVIRWSVVLLWDWRVAWSVGSTVFVMRCRMCFTWSENHGIRCVGNHVRYLSMWDGVDWKTRIEIYLPGCFFLNIERCFHVFESREKLFQCIAIAHIVDILGEKSHGVIH